MMNQATGIDPLILKIERQRVIAGVKGRNLGVLYALLFAIGLLTVLVFEWAIDTVPWSTNTKLLATIVFLMGSFPMLLYLASGDFQTIPFFEGHCLFYSLSFGFAGFRPIIVTGRLSDINDADYFKGLFAAFLCLTFLFIGFYFAGKILWRHIRPFTAGLADDPKRAPILLVSLLVAVVVTHSLAVLGVNWILQIQQACMILFILFYGVSVYSGLLPRWMVLLFWTVGLPWMMLVGSGLLSNGQIGPLIQIGIWQVLAWLWARRRFSASWVVVMIAAVLVLQPIKGFYRNIVWGGYSLNNSERISLISEMIGESFKSIDEEGSAKDSFEVAFSRLNHLIVTSGVIRDTPEVEPFQKGVTYLPLFVKWIPRLFWENKPIEDLGNRWARRYGYLHEADFATSFNLPWLTEMFMNFGWPGVIFISLAIGIVFRFLWQLVARPTTTFDFSISIALLTGLIIVESHFSMTMGGAVVRAILFAIVVYAIKWFYLYIKPSGKKTG